MGATTSVAKTTARVAAWVVALACAGSSAAAQDTKLGFAIGAGVPVAGIALQEPTLSVSGWLARPIHGPYRWRVEVGRMHLQMAEDDRFRCAAAAIFCDAEVYVSAVGIGLQIEPLADKALAPYGYATISLYHNSASGEATGMGAGSAQVSSSWSDNAIGIGLGSGLRIRLADRWALRLELRYSGFGWEPGTVNWASVVTPGVTMSVAF
jgi:opacity protein-like surface antigen